MSHINISPPQRGLRPDGALIVDKVLLLHNEDRAVNLLDAVQDLKRNLQKPQNPLLLGKTPFIVVMACAGQSMQFGYFDAITSQVMRDLLWIYASS